jgi:hypothetical protein
MRAHQFSAAIDELKARSQAQPNDASVRQMLSSALWYAGRQEEAAAQLESAYRVGGETRNAAAMRDAFRRGRFQAVNEWRLSQARKMAATRYVSAVVFADYAARLRRADETLRYLELAYKEHSTQMVRISDNPAFDFLRSDPRFQALLQKMGLPAPR